MGIFGRSRENRRLDDVEDSLQKLKRDFSALELEWIDFLDKAKRTLMRTVARAKFVEKAEEEEAPETQATLPGLVGDHSTDGRLTPRQREIQQTILRRRAGG